jgi:endonuclease-3
LGNAFGINIGVVVDTHVKRLSNLLALTKEVYPEKIERDLIQLFPQENWTILSHLLIFHGREVCYARRPQCQLCMMSDLCPSATI